MLGVWPPELQRLIQHGKDAPAGGRAAAGFIKLLLQCGFFRADRIDALERLPGECVAGEFSVLTKSHGVWYDSYIVKTL